MGYAALAVRIEALKVLGLQLLWLDKVCTVNFVMWDHDVKRVIQCPGRI